MERAAMGALKLVNEEGRANMEKVGGVVVEVKVVVGVKEGKEGMGRAAMEALELVEEMERAKWQRWKRW